MCRVSLFQTLAETKWGLYMSKIPNEALAKQVFSDDKKLAEYMKLLDALAERTYLECEKLTEALETKAFEFTYKIGIDGLHQKEVGSHSKKQLKAGQRRGVLTFYIDGIPKQSKSTSSSSEPASPIAASSPAAASPSAKGASSAATPEAKGTGNKELSKKRKREEGKLQDSNINEKDTPKVKKSKSASSTPEVLACSILLFIRVLKLRAC